MSKKNLVQLIRKTAQELEDAPGVVADRPAKSISTTPAPDPFPGAGGEALPYATPTSATPSAGAPGMVSSPTVAKMQQELQGLARDMTSQVNMAQLAGPNKQLGPNATQEQQQALGRMSFADFITQHYTRDSDIAGVEFDWDPNKTDLRDKDPSKPTRTNVVMDTMTRVGNPKSGEFKIDGQWGPRTNAALRNAYAMGFGLLEMAKDFHYQPRTFTDQQLQQLKGLVPPTANALSDKEKSDRAKDIIGYLEGIRRLYREVEDHILNKTGFTPYIEGTQAYTTYSPGTTPDPKMIQALNQKFTNLKVTGTVQGRNVTVPITVNDLANTQSLAAWQKQNLPATPLLNILSQIKQSLGAS